MCLFPYIPQNIFYTENDLSIVFMELNSAWLIENRAF